MAALDTVAITTAWTVISGDMADGGNYLISANSGQSFLLTETASAPADTDSVVIVHGTERVPVHYEGVPIRAKGVNGSVTLQIMEAP